MATEALTPAVPISNPAPAIYDELYAVACHADFPPRQEKEHFESYAVRLLKAVYAATESNEELWTSLSESAQKWYNVAVNKMNAGVAIFECPGYTEMSEPQLEGRDLTRNIREIVAQHPNWNRNEVAKELKRIGWRDREVKLGTVSCVRCTMLDAMRVLKKLGMLKEEAPA